MAADGSNPRKLVQGREPFVFRPMAAASPLLLRPSTTTTRFTSSISTDRIGLASPRIGASSTGSRRFAPKGDRLVYNSEEFGGQELMLMQADGQGQTRISIAEETYEQEPVFSPDGKGIGLCGQDGARDEYDIYLVGTAGFDLDEMDAPPLMPINLTDNDGPRR